MAEAEDRGFVEELVARFVEMRERGEEVDVVAFAEAHPGGGAELLAALRAVEEAEVLFAVASGEVRVPEVVGGYFVEGVLGQGGMGRVLRVRGEDGVVRALKVLHETLALQPRALERFRREAAALRRLRHPGVVRFSDAGVYEGRPFLVMDLVEGPSLAERVQAAREEGAEFVELPGNGPPDVRAARLVASVARAVGAAHEAGVLHRDLTTRNVLLGPGGPVVVDFGLVRSEGADTLTVTGDVVGTPATMAPEQARGEHVDVRADVFALGLLLFELVTLAPARESGDTFAALRQATTRPVADPRAVRGDVPAALARIIRRATGFRPAWRHPTLDALAEELEAFAEGRPTGTPRPGLVQRGVELWLRRRALVLAAAAALVVAGALGVYAAGGGFRAGAVTDAELGRVRNELVCAWLDGERTRAEEALERLGALAPEERMLPFYRAMVAGEPLTSSDDALVQTVIEAEALRLGGRPLEAADLYHTAWSMEPGTVLLPVLKGKALLAAGDPESAIEHFEAIVATLFEAKTLHLLLGDAFEALGDRPEDVVLARRNARALDREDPLTAFELARAQLEADLADDALETMQAAVRLDDDRVEALLEERAEARGNAATADLRRLVESARAGSTSPD